MKVKKSFLKFKDFIITEFYYEYYGSKEDDEEYERIIEDDFNNVPIDIDFGIDVLKAHKDYFMIPIQIVINPKKLQKHLIHIDISAYGEFFLENDSKIPEEDRFGALYFHALPLLIASIRDYIMIATTYLPTDKYILPPLNLDDLLAKKFKLLKKKSKR